MIAKQVGKLDKHYENAPNSATSANVMGKLAKQVGKPDKHLRDCAKQAHLTAKQTAIY